MEDYIVRIAPCDPIDRNRISGHVEVVSKKERRPFKNINELVVLLIKREKGSDVKFRLEQD